MQIKLQKKGRTLIASLFGELDHHSAKNVKEILETAIEQKSIQNLIFDFTNLNFMDSSGIGVIIGRYKLLSAIGGKVCIICREKTICRLITLSGLTRLMEVFQTIGEAESYMQGVK